MFGERSIGQLCQAVGCCAQALVRQGACDVVAWSARWRALETQRSTWCRQRPTVRLRRLRPRLASSAGGRHWILQPDVILALCLSSGAGGGSVHHDDGNEGGADGVVGAGVSRLLRSSTGRPRRRYREDDEEYGHDDGGGYDGDVGLSDDAHGRSTGTGEGEGGYLSSGRWGSGAGDERGN